MRAAASSPRAFCRREDARVFREKFSLFLGCQHDRSMIFVGRAERRKDPAANSEIRMSHVRVLHSFGQTQGHLAKLFGFHDATFFRQFSAAQASGLPLVRILPLATGVRNEGRIVMPL